MEIRIVALSFVDLIERWKKDLQLNGKNKKAALHKARLLYPTADLGLAKHHGRGEALLLGHWWLRHGAAHRAAA